MKTITKKGFSSENSKIKVYDKYGRLKSNISIKTINGQSILGSGNIVVAGSGGGSSNGYFPQGW
jgi:hypothetical protein